MIATNTCDMKGCFEKGKIVKMYIDEFECTFYLCTQCLLCLQEEFMQLPPNAIVWRLGETGMSFDCHSESAISLVHDTGINYKVENSKNLQQMVLRPLNVLGVDYFVVTKDNIHELLKGTKYETHAFSTRDGYTVNSYSKPEGFLHIVEREAKTNPLIKTWLEAPENSERVKQIRNGEATRKTQETQMFKAIKSWLKDLWSETYIIAEPTYEPRVPLHCEPMPEPTLEMTPDKTA
jgi:hypothetical protein